MTTQEKTDWQVHADHCIEYLRASAVCRPDTTSLTTFMWDGKSDKPMLRNEKPVHSCVDWKSLKDSMRERVVDEEEMQSITH